MKVLVTGATGFVGQELCRELLGNGFKIRAGTRSGAALGQKLHRDVEVAEVGEIGPDTDWTRALEGINTVVHLAARVHVMYEHALNPFDAFRIVTVEGTERLARAAVDAGVRRFIYVSSIKVNGESTSHNTAFTEADTPTPQDPYGMSKWEAEQTLNHIASNSTLEIVILRPPLVYGPGVGGNFIRLLNWVTRGIPLPLASVHNLRSLVYVGNLVDALVTCITHANAKGNTFLISDGYDISTAELIRSIAVVMGKQSRLFTMPEDVIRMLGQLTGKSAEVSRLIDSLVVNSSKIRIELGWQPPFSLSEGLHATVEWYARHRNNTSF